MILVLSEKRDESTNHVLDWIIGFGSNVIRVNAFDLKLDHIDFDNNIMVLNYKGKQIKSSEIRAVWHRRGMIKYEYPDVSTENKELTTHIRYHLYEEWLEVIRFLMQWLKNDSSVSFIGDYEVAEEKLEQLQCAKKMGLLIPNTLITSNKKDLVRFFKRCQNTIITKGISSSASFTFDNVSLEGYTEEVSETCMDTLPDTFFPSLFQENIMKAYELRIFFLKDVFYPMAIFSQENEKTKTDMRKYDTVIPNRTIPYLLPKNIEIKLLQTMNTLGLNMGSIDMIVDTKGDYYFLEVNPCGQFGMVSVPCNYYIEKSISKALIQK